MFLVFLGLCPSFFYFYFLFFSPMLSSSEVRALCPSVSARLGGSLGVFPYLDNFVFEGSSLSIALGDLLPLLHQSIDWFEGLEGSREQCQR